MVGMVEVVDKMHLPQAIHSLSEYLAEKVKGIPLSIPLVVKAGPIHLEEVEQVLEIGPHMPADGQEPQIQEQAVAELHLTLPIPVQAVGQENM